MQASTAARHGPRISVYLLAQLYQRLVAAYFLHLRSHSDHSLRLLSVLASAESGRSSVGNHQSVSGACRYHAVSLRAPVSCTVVACGMLDKPASSAAEDRGVSVANEQMLPAQGDVVVPLKA